VIEIDERVGGPEFFLQFFARYDFAAVFEKNRQELKRLLLKPDLQAVLAQFSSKKIHFEDPKAKTPGALMIVWHGENGLDERECTTGLNFNKASMGEEFPQVSYQL
jgi:hypothetical protein